MTRWLILAALLGLTGLASADCLTTIVNQPGQPPVICYTCCYGGICTVSCN